MHFLYNENIRYWPSHTIHGGLTDFFFYCTTAPPTVNIIIPTTFFLPLFVYRNCPSLCICTKIVTELHCLMRTEQEWKYSRQNSRVGVKTESALFSKLAANDAFHISKMREKRFKRRRKTLKTKSMIRFFATKTK